MARMIPASEITFHPSIDPNGKLFWWRGEPYRAIRRHHAAFTEQLFESGRVGQWAADGFLVPSERTDWTLPGFPMVLKHERIPFNAVAAEWSAPMFRDGALALLDFEAALEAQGLMLQDGHTDNLLFAGARPVFVDFCSIIPNIPAPVWEAEDEFRRNFLHPLRMMSAGQAHAMRWMLPTDRRGLSTSAQAATPPLGKRLKSAGRSLVPSRAYDRFKHEQRALQRRAAARRYDSAAARARRLADLRAQIAALTFPEPEGVARPVGTAQDGQASLLALLDRLRPATVLTLGDANAARVAACAGYPTALFALDEAESEREYRAAVAAGLPLLTVRPLARDAHEPWSWRDQRTDLDARFRADLVTATSVPVPETPDARRSLIEPMRRLSGRWLLLDAGWGEGGALAGVETVERTGAGLLCRVSPP